MLVKPDPEPVAIHCLCICTCPLHGPFEIVWSTNVMFGVWHAAPVAAPVASPVMLGSIEDPTQPI